MLQGNNKKNQPRNLTSQRNLHDRRVSQVAYLDNLFLAYAVF